MRDIGDVDAEQPAVCGLFQRDRVVEVLCIRAVDREDRRITQIQSACGADRLRCGVLGIAQYLVREFGTDAGGKQHGFIVGTERQGSAEVAEHLAARRAPSVTVVGDAHKHLVAGCGAARVCKLHRVGKPQIVRDDAEGRKAALRPLRLDERAAQLGEAARKNARDLAFNAEAAVRRGA